MTSLNGLTVLSMEQATVLPYFTYRLVQEGARVIRMEHPKYGDPNRKVGLSMPGEEGMNRYFLCINAGKEAITLNLAEKEGKGLLARLLLELEVDVFCTNQLPSSYAKLGIEPKTLREIKPDLIWLGVSGFGPDHTEAAYDPILQARGGLMELTGQAGGEPQVLGIPLPDMGTSEHAFGQIMKALYLREKTGAGDEIHLSMFASTVSWLTVPITLNKTFGQTITRRGNTHQFFAPVSVFPTKDGFIYLAVGNDRQFAAMVELKEFAELARPEYQTNQGRIEDVKKLNRELARLTSRLSSDKVVELLKSIKLPVSKIQTVKQVVADPLINPTLLNSKDPVTGLELTLAPPPIWTSYLKERQGALSFPPRKGEHNRSVYSSLGLKNGRLDELASNGVI
ncbi:CaiB/BaiF CoA transferase family protein [Dethiosulfatarculus sandiegensis]|uniref:CMP-binding protein n=1 Tax=Dethiosulfatarculus sandiegensis TaxID=1429043 RepID=A0A0D2J2A7_9BACT|nr:CoA transferase [Dethiosulfatarculus sandiegensis]KIX12359.1 CMP-binding protein [Dethiosulfatarculus sandiegensis]